MAWIKIFRRLLLCKSLLRYQSRYLLLILGLSNIESVSARAMMKICPWSTQAGSFKLSRKVLRIFNIIVPSKHNPATTRRKANRCKCFRHHCVNSEEKCEIVAQYFTSQELFVINIEISLCPCATFLLQMVL